MTGSKLIGALPTGIRGVLLFAVVGILAAAVYAWLSPQWYEAQVAVVPATSSKGPGTLAGLAGALPIDLPIDIGGGGSDVERIYAVLRSRSVTDAVIDKFGLIERYDSKYIESTRKLLWRHCSAKLDKKPSVVTVACEDTDPRLAQEMAEYFGQYGNTVFRRVSASSASEERRFLEQRVTEAKQAVEAASAQLRGFEEKNRLIDLGEQSKAVVSAMAALKGELLSKQLQLSYLSSFSSSDEATAAQLRRQQSAMEGQMKELEGAYASTVPSSAELPAPSPTGPGNKRHREQDLFPQASTVPRLRFQLAELYRQQKIQETLFLLLTQRYEMAKVNEARDTSTFQILDHASLPTHRSRPARAELVLAGGVVGLLLGLAWHRYKRTLEAAIQST